MNVELKQFCQDFSAILSPLAMSLDRGIVAIHNHGDDAALRPLLSQFVDIQHRLKILTDKAEQQHAYLLIFGPLKSGKSTLMNAVSGSYVSEVSSLPAYPCLVYVRDEETPTYSATRFDGSKQVFHTNGELQDLVASAHEDLAAKIRQADAENREFNPAQDFPKAIRRVDIGLNAPNLRSSGTILVDTPGLYTRMKYSYDLLTRDFRNNAACAVFVVKAENLFLEQVFDEFKDLVGVFSRVFLVVNIDSSKKDLGPDGELKPALESANPRRIIRAFEDLTMSSQLREAIDAGQLRIYLVDLLDAASRSLKGKDFSADDETATPFALDDDPASPEEGQVGYTAFLRDLTDYLNSSSYITEFMADSLRQSKLLNGEIVEALESDALKEFRGQTESIDEQARSIDAKVESQQKLEAVQWDQELEKIETAVKKDIEAFAHREITDLREKLATQIEEWFSNDESLSELIDNSLQPAVKKTAAGIQDHGVSVVRERLNNRNSGPELSGEIVGLLHKLDLSLDGIYRDFEPHIAEREQERWEPSRIDIDQQQVPVKKGLMDWVAFRRPAAIRRKLFGTEIPSDAKIPAPVKQKKLGEAAQDTLKEEANRYVEQVFDQRRRQGVTDLLADYKKFFQEKVTELLRAQRAELQAHKKEFHQQYETNRKLITALDNLQQDAQAYEAKADSLHQRYVAPRLEENARSEAAHSRADAEDVDDADEPIGLSDDAFDGMEESEA